MNDICVRSMRARTYAFIQTAHATGSIFITLFYSLSHCRARKKLNQSSLHMGVQIRPIELNWTLYLSKKIQIKASPKMKWAGLGFFA